MAETVRYEEYRGLTLSVRGDEDAIVHYPGVVEWNLETGVSLTSREASLRMARHAVDAHLDQGVAPGKALAVGHAAAMPLARQGVPVETASGEYQVFHLAEGLDEEEDPYLTRPGWYHQPVDFDGTPEGPFGSFSEASDEAVEHGASAKPSGGR